MLDALTKAEELITHAIGDTPEARETLRAIRRARTHTLRLAVRLAECGAIDPAEGLRILERSG